MLTIVDDFVQPSSDLLGLDGLWHDDCPDNENNYTSPYLRRYTLADDQIRFSSLRGRISNAYHRLATPGQAGQNPRFLRGQEEI